MIELLACIGLIAGMYSVWMSLANKAEAQRLRELINGSQGGFDKVDFMVGRLSERDKATKGELLKIYEDIKSIGALSRRLDGDMQKLRGDVSLISQSVKELELKTDKTNGQLKCFVSALTEGAKVTQKWFPDDRS